MNSEVSPDVGKGILLFYTCKLFVLHIGMKTKSVPKRESGEVHFNLMKAESCGCIFKFWLSETSTTISCSECAHQ